MLYHSYFPNRVSLSCTAPCILRLLMYFIRISSAQKISHPMKGFPSPNEYKWPCNKYPNISPLASAVGRSEFSAEVFPVDNL